MSNDVSLSPAKHSPAQFSLYAILAVAIADALGFLMTFGQRVLGGGVFSWSWIVTVFWDVAQAGLLIGAAAALGWFIHKHVRDAAAGAAGYCLARLVVEVIPFLRSGVQFGHGSYQALEAFKDLLAVGSAGAAFFVLVLMLRKWPAETKP